jgi:hypothetical protein
MFAPNILRVILRHPTLWAEALRTFVAFTPSRWWRQRPFLPVPRPVYIVWRLQTAYGSPDTPPDPVDIVHFLQWRRSQR